MASPLQFRRKDPARQTRQASTRAMVESNASGRRRSNSNFRDDLNQLSTSLRRASIRTRTNSTRTSSIPLEARDTAPPEVQPHSNALQPLNRNSRMLTAQLANPEFRINFPSVTTSNPSHASRSRDHHPLRQASDIPLCIRLQMDFIESQLSTLEGELEITNSFPEAEAEDQGEEAEDEGYQSIDA
ncbi:MAG: hypothetical protein M1834_003105 [Cirrosporium novae-zelandiae]|nr:MAG: hypothetical protein M1834_003105 [Cirrosporium novae-zelandiae]